jgi:hypothetical protein
VPDTTYFFAPSIVSAKGALRVEAWGVAADR